MLSSYDIKIHTMYEFWWNSPMRRGPSVLYGVGEPHVIPQGGKWQGKIWVRFFFFAPEVSYLAINLSDMWLQDEDLHPWRGRQARMIWHVEPAQDLAMYTDLAATHWAAEALKNGS
jgi:hypothetical protein